MFSEILKIIPVLDPSRTKQMENSLSSRFSKIAKMFGKGLHAAIKGSIIGISLGLLAKLLNPIEALEEKIQKLLGEGEDLRDLADQFGTKAGNIKRVQDVAHATGVTPEQFKDMLTKYADAIEKAKKELEDPFAVRSDSTRAVQNFTGEKDKLKGFLQFMGQIKATQNGTGHDIFFGEREQQRAAVRERTGEKLNPEERQSLMAQGLMKHLSPEETQKLLEQAVFGNEFHGAQKRFMNADLNATAAQIKEPSAEKLDSAVNKLASLEDQRRMLQVQNDTADMMNGASKINPSMIAAMEAARAAEQKKETDRLSAYADLRRAADAIEVIKGVLDKVIELITRGVGYLATLVGYVVKATPSNLLRQGLKSILGAPPSPFQGPYKPEE